MKYVEKYRDRRTYVKAFVKLECCMIRWNFYQMLGSTGILHDEFVDKKLLPITITLCNEVFPVILNEYKFEELIKFFKEQGWDNVVQDMVSARKALRQ